MLDVHKNYKYYMKKMKKTEMKQNKYEEKVMELMTLLFDQRKQQGF